MLIIRPYKGSINNVIEIINELSLFFIITLMFIMSSEAKWMVYEDLLFSVIGLNSMIVLKILLGTLKISSI